MASPSSASIARNAKLVGLFLNPGQTWCLLAREVLTHDFRSQSFGVALPYGIYDLLINAGTVVVGTSHDTAEFAVDAIETWLTTYGWFHHPHMTELLVLCDSGGSNGARNLLWKYCLYQRLAQAYGLSITVCHYPSGASKWNPIDHRLFSFISLNWAGVPLEESYELILKYIRTTTTTTGLTIDATLNRKRYDTGKKIKPQLSRADRHPTQLDPAAVELYYSPVSYNLCKPQLISAQPLRPLRSLSRSGIYHFLNKSLSRTHKISRAWLSGRLGLRMVVLRCIHVLSQNLCSSDPCEPLSES